MFFVSIFRWIEKNAMDCLIWVILQINKYKQHIPQSERFYEKEYDEYVCNQNIDQHQLTEFEKLAKVNIAQIAIDPVASSSKYNEATTSGENQKTSMKTAKRRIAQYPSWLDNLEREGINMCS